MSESKSGTKDGRKTDDIKWNTTYLTERKEKKSVIGRQKNELLKEKMIEEGKKSGWRRPVKRY